MENHHVLGPATYPGTQQTQGDKKQTQGHSKVGGAVPSKGNQRQGPLKNFGRPSELNTNESKQISRALTLSPDKRNMANSKRHGGYQNAPGYNLINGSSAAPARTQNNSLCDEEDYNNKDETSAATTAQQVATTLATKANRGEPFSPNSVAINHESDAQLQLQHEQMTAGIIVSQKIALKDKQIERDLRKLQMSEAYSQHYEFQRVLGEGAFCTVYQAVDKETNEQIAVKVIKRKTLHKEGVEQLKQEAELLQSMDHKNIVKFKHFKEIKGKIFLGMELMRGGQLSELILAKKQQQKDFSDEEASQIIKVIFEAVNYLHSNEIVHRDLKPDNILISDPSDLSSLKVADFGLSAKYEHQTMNNDADQVGTLIFMSPELIQKRRYSPGVDVFAIGIVMYMLLTGGEHPLYDSDDFTTDKYRKSLLALSQFRFPEHLSPLASNLFHRLTKFNTSMRYTAHEALKHPWITRLNKTLIPMTLQDKIENMQTEHNFRSKIGMMLFLSNVSQADNYVENSTFQDYKQLLKKVTFKIEKWYEKRQSGALNGEKFLKDEDFVELDNSPDRFEDSSEEIEETEELAEDTEPDSGSKLDVDKLTQQNFLFGMSPDRIKESPRRSTKDKSYMTTQGSNEIKMRLHATNQKSEEHAIKANSSAIKNNKSSKQNSTSVADSDDFSFLNKRNAATNFSQHTTPAQHREKSPILKKSTVLNLQTATTQVAITAISSPSPRKKNGKKKGLITASKADEKTSSYLTNISSAAVENQTGNANPGVRNKNTNGNGLYTQVISQERISVQKSAKTAQKVNHKVIKREDIVPFSINKQFSVSPKQATDSINEQASSNYNPGNDYDYQTPYKASHGNGRGGEKTDTDKPLSGGQKHFNSDVNKFQAKSGAGTNGTYYGIVGSFSKSERQNQQDVESSTRQNESFERLYSSFTKNENNGTTTQMPIKKKVFISSKKGQAAGASMRSQEFADEDRGELREIRSNELISMNGDKKSSDRSQQKPKGLSTARRNSQVDKIHDSNILSSGRRRRETEDSYEDFNMDSGQFNLEQRNNQEKKAAKNDFERSSYRDQFLSDEGNQTIMKSSIADVIYKEGESISPTGVRGSKNFKTLGAKSTNMTKLSHQNHLSEECYAASNSSMSEEKELAPNENIFGEFEIKNLKSGNSKGKRKSKGQKRKESKKAVVAMNLNGINGNYSAGINSQNQKYQSAEDAIKPNEQSSLSHHQPRGGLGQRGNFKDGVSRTGNASISHQIAQSRFEVERKRNSGYDQKFLFKKNFIPKYQPNSTLPLNGPVPNMSSKVGSHHHFQNGSGSGKKYGGGDNGKRYDSNFKLKGNQSNKKTHTNVSFEDQDIIAIKNKSQPFSQRAGAIGYQNQSNFGFAEKKNDLPRIDPGSHSTSQQHHHTHKQKKLKSGSAKVERPSHEGSIVHSAGMKSHSNKTGGFGLIGGKATTEDKELTAVRQRIGTILQSNHAHEEGSSLDLFGKDMIIKTQKNTTNAVKLAGEASGLAPPTTMYPKAQTSTEVTNPNCISEMGASKVTYNSSHNEQSSDVTLRSRNNAAGGGGSIFDRTSDKKDRANTHKITKKFKENDLNIGPMQQLPPNSNSNLPIQPVLRKDSLKQLSQSETKSMRQKNSSKVFMNSKLQEAERHGESVPRPLDQRLSHPFGTQSTFIPTAGTQANVTQQRTQSNPNNRVTAFIKIHHMPAEILLSQQKPGPALHSNNPNGQMRSHHLNAMLGQHSRMQHNNHDSGSQANHHHHTKVSPYNNSANIAKQWTGGRPVNGIYPQHHVQSPLMAEKSLIVMDSSKQKKIEASMLQDSNGSSKQGGGAKHHNQHAEQMRHMNIVRNMTQMGSSTGQGVQQVHQAQMGRGAGIGGPQRSSNPAAADSNSAYFKPNGVGQVSYHHHQQKGQVASPVPQKNTMAPFIRYGPMMGSSNTVLEPGVGISGISINDKSFQSYNNFNTMAGGGITQVRGVPHAVYQNQNSADSKILNSAMKGGIGKVTAFERQHSLNAKNQVNSHHSTPHDNPQFLHSPSSALDTELLQHQNLEFIGNSAVIRNHNGTITQKLAAGVGVGMGAKHDGADSGCGLNSLLTVQNRNHGYAVSNEPNDVYNNGICNKSDQMFYGRQNSDQTACVRNMRSVLHQNDLQQKNNFINIGTQQIKSPTISSNQHLATVVNMDGTTNRLP